MCWVSVTAFCKKKMNEQELLFFSPQHGRKRWEFLYLDTEYDGFQGEVWGQNTLLVGGGKHKKLNSESEPLLQIQAAHKRRFSQACSRITEWPHSSSTIVLHSKREHIFSRNVLMFLILCCCVLVILEIGLCNQKWRVSIYSFFVSCRHG